MIKYHANMIQGSDEWLSARCGLMTASEMKLIITPTLKVASNDKERSHLFELAAQRITRHVEPKYISDDMMRGHEEEILARKLYSENFSKVADCGFITNDKWGFTIGYSPDGLVGDDGVIEVKSRRQKYQIETIITDIIPEDYKIQVQTGLLVSGRKWCDFISYSGGLPMVTIRVLPDPSVQDAILVAATAFEMRLEKRLMEYRDIIKTNNRLMPTERTVETEITI